MSNIIGVSYEFSQLFKPYIETFSSFYMSFGLKMLADHQSAGYNIEPLPYCSSDHLLPIVWSPLAPAPEHLTHCLLVMYVTV
jgi:hypothetical protein